MRAIGASDGAVLRIVMAEGVIIGLLSWVVGSLLTYPLSLVLSDAVGVAFVGVPLSFAFSGFGTLLWLLLVVGLATLASFLPARNASHLTVRDVLAYE